MYWKNWAISHFRDTGLGNENYLAQQLMYIIIGEI